MKIINLFGAPSAGKSTCMLGMTYYMKNMGLSVENTPEFFKELIYEHSPPELFQPELFGGQLYILGEQNRRLARLLNKNDFAVTDCPLPLIAYYTDEKYIAGFKELVNNLFNSYDNVNYLILRRHEFENEKRVHDESKAREIEQQLPLFLDQMGIKYKTVVSQEENLKETLPQRIINDLIADGVISREHLCNSRSALTRQKYGCK